MASLALLSMPAESLLGCKKQTNKRAIYELKQIDCGSEINEQLINNSKLYFLTTENKLKIKVTVWRNESKGDSDGLRNLANG